MSFFVIIFIRDKCYVDFIITDILLIERSGFVNTIMVSNKKNVKEIKKIGGFYERN
ncbi:MAG TPA: hypothetical protein GX708_00195 [Gallicola sp.]|nr:hypothetical protein [Gallicola sp.]